MSCVVFITTTPGLPYPLPLISDTLEALAGSEWFCSLDLASGYPLVELDERDREKTALSTGLFQWKVMPFGICNAPKTFERWMELVLAGLCSKFVWMMLSSMGRPPIETLHRLTMVWDRFRASGLTMKAKKFQTEVYYLGHTVSRHGIATDPHSVSAVRDCLSLQR